MLWFIDILLSLFSKLFDEIELSINIYYLSKKSAKKLKFEKSFYVYLSLYLSKCFILQSNLSFENHIFMKENNDVILQNAYMPLILDFTN